MKELLKYYLFTFLMLGHFNLFAQYEFVGAKSFHYPNELDFNQWKSTLSLTLAKLPEDVVEEASSYVYAPLINFDLLYGLPFGFSTHGNLSTNWITFHLSLGPKWSYRFNRFSISFGYDIAYVYGRLYKFGFDSEMKAWLNYPNASIGFAFNKFTLSFMTTATFITHLEQFNDDIKLGIDKNRISGISFGITVEQPLWKDNFISLSFKGNYTRLYYPSWAAFPTWDRYSFIPEVIIGLIL